MSSAPPMIKVECVDCKRLPADQRPKTPRPTDVAIHPRSPRCATHRRQRRKEAKLRRQQAYQSRVYGLDPESHNALLAFQGNRCAICVFANGSSKALATDHDHSCCDGPTSCGSCVRGKLCGPDNELVGRITLIAGRNNESPKDVLIRLIEYFDDPPMAKLRRLKRIPAQWA